MNKKNRSFQVSGSLIIAQLLISLACSSTSISSLFASPTPTVTNTPIPTTTPTQTPSPTPLPSGVQIGESADGRTEIVDYDGGYQFNLSKDWTVLPADNEKIIEIAEQLKDENPEFSEALLSIKLLGSDTLRLFAVNKNRDVYDQGTFANLNVLSIKDKFSATIDLDLFIEVSVEQIPNQLKDAKVLSSGVMETINGVPYGYMDIELNTVITGKEITAYEKIIAIQSGEYVSLMTFAVSSSRKEVLLPMIQEFLDTLQLLH